jgi:uncharacterized protein YdhG (YjbR/CyaY superfamily)
VTVPEVSAQDPRIDAYIAEAADWAKPILNHLRTLPTMACPSAAETIKWGSPWWDLNGMLCGFAVFKTHCAFVLPHEKEIPEIGALSADGQTKAWGALGRIASLDDLPPDADLIKAIQLIAAYNQNQKTRPSSARSAPTPKEVPADLVAALEQNEAARIAFEDFPPGKRNEYIEWLDEAKTAATRQKRLAQAIEWIAEGKGRNWKYQR